MSRQVPPAGQPLLTVGRYTLFGEIAKGGMATVHFGRMISLGGFSRTVAIKRMRRDIALDPEFIAMFIDEARLAARIEHPNVVATLDVVAEAGEVFLVMEYVKGETLARLARASESRGQPVPIQVACGIMCGALSGLHAAHEAVGESGQPLGIVHRDVSPQNVLVGEDGVPRITDFGIAKAETRLQVTHDGQMKGKLGYMAPEQLGGGGRRIDRRVDLFTAAIVLWELLAGRRLFLADSPAETLANILTGSVPPLRSIRQDVPPLLDSIVLKALSRDPQQRPATAEVFATSLEEAIDHRLASSRMIGSWVGSLAGHVLESRTRYVREIESIGIVSSDSQSAAAPAVPATSTPQERQPAPGAGAPRAPMASKPLLGTADRKGGLAPPRLPGSVPSASPQPAPHDTPRRPPAPPAASRVAPSQIVSVGTVPATAAAPTDAASGLAGRAPAMAPKAPPGVRPVAPPHPAQIEGFPDGPSRAASSPNVVQPGSSPNVLQPGSSPNVLQPGSSPNVLHPGSSPNVLQPGSSPNVLQPGSSPNVLQPGSSPNVLQPGSSPDLDARVPSGNWTPPIAASALAQQDSNPALGAEPITGGHPMELYAREDSLLPPRRSLPRGVLIGSVVGVIAAGLLTIGIAVAVGSGSSSGAEGTATAPTASTSTPQAVETTAPAIVSAAPAPSESAVETDASPPDPAASGAPSSSADKSATKATAGPLVPLPPVTTKKPPPYLPERP